MRFPSPPDPNALVPATLLRRYKRFLSDAVLEDGREVTAHCPNPGSMMGLKDEGARIWLLPNDDPKKKLKYGWRLVEVPGGHFVGIDTGLTNALVKEALAEGRIDALSGYSSIKPEQKYGEENSRIDFLLSDPERADAYVEVKSCTLSREDDWAEFPDCVTERGAKHLRELTKIAQSGARAVMLYVVQRTDCTRFRLAADLDPAYTIAFDAAREAGVEVLCHGTDISPEGITLTGPLLVDPSPQAPLEIRSAKA